ncbi:Uncharacterized protein TCM_011060 [Theobroma cacao]|uniref:Uncharacterized protein n=1 Tax=Theobroma cacao TaxID=3641 RepID=A0A061E9R9_THECC|nr:Uncharacterized protein TCM_011060 [Theobroma cacao]
MIQNGLISITKTTVEEIFSLQALTEVRYLIYQNANSLGMNEYGVFIIQNTLVDHLVSYDLKSCEGTKLWWNLSRK